MDEAFTTREEIYHRLYKIMCIERIYILTFSLLLLNIVMLIFMFINDFFYDKLKTYYLIIFFSMAPLTWMVKGYLIWYFYKMGMYFVNSLSVHSTL